VLLLLASEGIDINPKDEEQFTALMYACEGSNIEIVKALLAALKKTSNFDINDTNYRGMTALMLACINNHVEITNLLLSIPHISIRLENNRELTALECAKGRENEDEIRALFHGELIPLQL
jgi:ankyrin repeat protein